jgi:2'-5' RNA ligase
MHAHSDNAGKLGVTSYAIVSYLDADISARIYELQQKVSDITGSRTCVDYNKPHITVGSEVFVDPDEHADLVTRLEKVARGTSPCSISVSGFGFMDNWSGGALPGHTKFAVYLKVVDCWCLEHLANRIKEEVTVHYPKYYEVSFPYKPRVTLAYKDLTCEGFEKAKEYLTQGVFVADTVMHDIAIAHKNEQGTRVLAQRFPLRGGGQ